MQINFFQILISLGANCAEALEPKEVISNRTCGLHAVKAILDWCVVMSISCTSESGDKVSRHRVSLEEAGSRNLGKHHFCIVNEVKYTAIKDRLNKIYHSDFTEAVQQKRFEKMLSLSDELSWDGQKFLRFIKKKL